MISILPKNKTSCCGCGGCEQACPVGCVTLKEDEEGFLYPHVDETRCIHCDKCERVCPVIRAIQTKEAHLGATIAFGGYHKIARIRKDSSSGGAFTFLADQVLAEDGVVYGCELGNDHVARHVRISSSSDLYRLRRSKYVQSDTRGVYAQVESDLRKGFSVLFVGTPCQISGLSSYLGDDEPNLYTCDFICHGVPSPTVFAEYIRSIESKYGEKVEKFYFRTKDKGWSSFLQ